MKHLIACILATCAACTLDTTRDVEGSSLGLELAAAKGGAAGSVAAAAQLPTGPEPILVPPGGTMETCTKYCKDCQTCETYCCQATTPEELSDVIVTEEDVVGIGDLRRR
jgi:hypothetical protein